MIDIDNELNQIKSNVHERGDREPKLQIGEALANYFNVSVSYLLGLDDKAKSNKKIKANIFVWVHNDELTERHEVTDFEIDDNVVIADENGEKWIYPLTSIMGIEVLSNEVN
jgi:transcriptional regulator with XRE-family HTH domain